MGILFAIVLFVVVSLAYVYSSYELITVNNNLGAKRNIGRGIIHTNNDYARMCYIVSFFALLLAAGSRQARLLSLQLRVAHDVVRRLHRHHGGDDRFPGVSAHHDVQPYWQALSNAIAAHGGGDRLVHAERPVAAGEHLLSGPGGAGGELRAAVHLLLHVQQAELGDVLFVPAVAARFPQQFRRLRVLPRLHALSLLPARASRGDPSL